MLWTLPVVGAVLGWLTNWVAIRMLFRPKLPFGLWKFKIQGLIPSRKKELATSVAATIDTKLVEAEDLEQVLTDARTTAAVQKAVDEYMTDVVRKNLGTLYAAASALGREKYLTVIPGLISEQLIRRMPQIAGRLAENLKASLDLKALIAKKINKFSDDELEETVLGIANTQLRAIEYWGLLIGGTIGGLQWLFLHLSGPLS
jgi:uncharacterized membrane protein YheB (UPF0754 family)